jgi:hypothetical protein
MKRGMEVKENGEEPENYIRSVALFLRMDEYQ